MYSRLIMALAMALFMSIPALGIAQTSATTGLILQATVATENATGIVGEMFVLDGSKSVDDNTVKTYTWTQLSGPYKFRLASGAKISITPTTAGTYEFELKATDSSGSSATVKKIKLEVKQAYVTQNNESNLDFVTKPATTTGGTEDINIGVGELQEGTKLEQTGVEPDEIDFMGENEQTTNFGVLLGGDSDDEEASGKGKVEVTWKVEEGEKLTPVFLELDGVPGESDDDEAAQANDRLVNAGPQDGWPKGGVRIAVGDVKGLTTEQKQGFLATVKTWAEVNSEQDLQNFAIGVMLADDQPAETLSLNYEEIKFTYSMPAKLFGFIPTSYRADVSIDKGNNENWDAGQVKVKFPWYSFLMRKATSMNELTHVLQQGVAEAKKGNVEYNWKVEEGEKLEQTGVEPDEIDFMGESEDTANQASDDGHKDWINLVSFSQMAQLMTTVSNVMKTKHDTVKNSIGNVR